MSKPRTEEEYKKLVEEHYARVKKLMRGIRTYQTVREDEFKDIKLECNHNWKSYMGLTDSYDYCTGCDEKRHAT